MHARLQRADGTSTRVGLERHGSRWTARADEQDLARLSELYARCAVCCFEPGSHELIGGGGEGRRAYLDWGVFHVEPGFLPLWRRCQRALEQRGALLRTAAGPAEFAPWHEELGRSWRGGRQPAAPLRGPAATPARGRRRPSCCPSWAPATLAYQAGLGRHRPRGPWPPRWTAELERDRRRGLTSRGPHRADWQLAFERAPRPRAPFAGPGKAGCAGLRAGAGRAAPGHRWASGPSWRWTTCPRNWTTPTRPGSWIAWPPAVRRCCITGTEASPPLRDRIAPACLVPRGT